MPPDLGHIYDEHAPSLFAFVLNFTRSEAETHDVLQELFLKLATHPAQLTGVRDLRGYLIRLAHRLAIDAFRRRASHASAIERAAAEPVTIFAPAPDADAQSFRDALGRALAELPPEQRAIAHLHLWEGRTFAEIAAALEIPANTAASRYRYAIDKLQALLRPLYEELP